MSSLLRYKNDAKRIKYTLMVTGPSGTGKSTFVNALLDTNLLPHRYQPVGSTVEEPTVVSYYSEDSTQTREVREFDPYNDGTSPTMSITASQIEIVDEDDTKIALSIIDTPGFGSNINNEICIDEILNYLKAQFDHVLAEETRIRRNPKFLDSRVHVCLYFVEATGHGLRELDVECMKKLSKYVNVLPVISKADSFTPDELKLFKRNILLDISRYSVPVFEFNYDEMEDDDEIIEETKFLRSLQPFAVIGSQEKAEIGGVLKHVRTTPWGVVDCEQHSDFAKLKDVLFGSHLQDFKDLTTDFLYENYRSEKLSSVTSISGNGSSSSISGGAGGSSSTPVAAAPSLSNLAALTATPKQQHSPSSSLSSFQNHVDINTSPIKEISNQIKQENESIISSIKNSPRTNYLNNPNRDQLRVISETVPYVLKHESFIQRQQKLQELEERSARELAIRAAALERKAAELKRREKLKRAGSAAAAPGGIKKEETLTDLSSILNED